MESIVTKKSLDLALCSFRSSTSVE